MCRNIKTLFNLDPPASDEEVHAAALQYVRKLSGYKAPSRVNEAAFDCAVASVFHASRDLLGSLETSAPTRNRQREAEKARERAEQRFGTRH